MLKVLIDHDFNHRILRALVRRIPHLDAVTAHQARLSDRPDTDLIEWAAGSGRVIVTHDRKTMPAHAVLQMKSGRKISGIIVAAQNLPLLDVIRDLEIIVTCSDEVE